MKDIIKLNFPNFNPQLIEEIEENAYIQNMKAGETIMRSGQFIRHTVLVVKGKIKLYREDDEGNEYFMYYLQPGQACAISMICATKEETSALMAKVVEDAELIMIPLALMEKWMSKHRSWYEFVIETYRSRFEEVLTVIDNIAFKAMDERLEFYLKRHRDACNCNDIKLSHQEIASELNTSREVVSRLLKKMEQRGLVKLYRSHIEINF
ncbi:MULTISPECIES: Crp/Fnr family transcriptional regulator [Flavobacterium]|uniref:Crp/Fnr family transcriptional regulator n=1 Tax=Flavobacterium covae TaxID=2906076 RepID=A0ABW8PKI4_9FLAO|nr:MULTISPECIES: Crp/Fnr family transcriptional regulator [Flavobacterium]OXA75249.1 Crp/Fnr family transcriptional regulator [Flavobacterium columnare NBRC 100251 = ATCC 23463]AMA49139.1 Crp/Fnr family transcriptional regulator [Flavobacterium covae]AND64790.1 Crp/Fnr family transcriptional regulator [Flavobacterium covae]MCJ1807394.1 Crp/Fnr family transcriptional regulator [Flavobacterium covae]MCJ1810460.1 Crp/Fnr family transcriptional regulator [Flavobacterium covae]